MFRRIGCIITVIVICMLAASCAHKDKQELVLEKMSYVRWYEADQLLEVYVAVANQSEKVLHFRAKVVMLRPELIDATGIERVELTADDRGGTPPFTLKPHQETVFKQAFRTYQPLTQKLLKSGAAIEVNSDGAYSCLIPIQNGEIQ